MTKFILLGITFFASLSMACEGKKETKTNSANNTVIDGKKVANKTLMSTQASTQGKSEEETKKN